MHTNSTTYFDRGGPENTRVVLEAMRERAATLETPPAAIIITTTTGATALKAAEVFQDIGLRIVAATFQKHWWKKYAGPDPELVEKCRARGVEFMPDTPELDLLDHHKTDIINAWRVIGQGFKVAVQIASMCVDTGVITAGDLVMACGGSNTGADTAILVEPYGAKQIFRSNIVEIIAMPCHSAR